MKTQIYMLPNIRTQNSHALMVNLEFLMQVVEILNSANNLENAVVHLHALFALKLMDKRILFDYGITDKGIIVMYEDEIVLFTECDTYKYLNAE